MQANQKSVRLSVPLLVTAMLLASSFSSAQEASPQAVSPQAAPQSSSQPSAQQPGHSGVAIDPSAGPLQPRPTQDQSQPLPEAPQPAPTQQSSQPPAQTLPPEPLGAAAAEQIKTAGGAASRPAGNAIAPARQHQYRSLFIKLGVVAAAGIAAGSVYGLSRATSSTPPHSASAAAK